MKKVTTGILGASLVLASAGFSHSVLADSVSEAFSSGKAYGDFRLRYEGVEQDNTAEDATALTLRTKLGYKTGSINGFSATVEFEDSRVVLGQDEYSLPGFIRPFYPGQSTSHSVVADPEVTELDQGFIQYKNDMVTAKLGAQVITLDGHRFVGHVGWRQDRQTFDAFSLVVTPADGLKITAVNIFERNRIFGADADQKANDLLLNVSYKTPVGKLTGYVYNLENDFGTDATNDTIGLSLVGSQKLDAAKLLYAVEFASQTVNSGAAGAADFDTDYSKLELGAVVSGVTVKVGQEVLGSDDGAVGFSTPLATLHKFNGWADLFLGTPSVGLEDFYVSASSKVGPGKFTVAYHDFTADEASAALDDLGTELNMSYGMKFGKSYNAGIKYAAYSADDFAVDTDKLWVWVGAKF